MKLRISAVAMACVFFVFAIPAAKADCDNNGRCIVTSEISAARHHHVPARISGDPRPRAWCGWWMRQHLGVSDRAGNLARWWARFGTNAHGPAVGALVVWRHHVGIITGRAPSGWIVKSGNDGHAVRERERSLRGAIAFRWPNRMASR